GERVSAHRVEWRLEGDDLEAPGIVDELDGGRRTITIEFDDGDQSQTAAHHGGNDEVLAESLEKTWLSGLTRASVRTVPAEWLKPGDIVKLGASDVVPADLRLLAATELEVDESSLTGESLPVSKSAPAVPGAELADRTC